MKKLEMIEIVAETKFRRNIFRMFKIPACVM